MQAKEKDKKRNRSRSSSKGDLNKEGKPPLARK